jgi:hypothetical protein
MGMGADGGGLVPARAAAAVWWVETLAAGLYSSTGHRRAPRVGIFSISGPTNHSSGKKEAHKGNRSSPYIPFGSHF